MQSSPDVHELAIALSVAQAKFKPAVKNKKNPHFRSNYADLDSIMESVREPLTTNGLSILQGVSTTPERFVRITTRLLHKSGQWIESSLDLRPDKDAPQQVGSVITYGRRYGVSAMLGITSDEDDDGNMAQGPMQQQIDPQAAQKQKERLELEKRRIAFAEKCEELGINKSAWAQIAQRLRDSQRSIDDIQDVVNEMEHERHAAKETRELKETF